MLNSIPKISFVAPVYNEENNLEILYERIRNSAAVSRVDYEVIFVDDGSTDNSLNVMKRLCGADEKVLYISLSRNFGHQNAIFAGMTYAKGEAVVTMDADLQHPPSLIPQMVKLWRKGAEVVYTKKNESNLPPLKHFIVKASYRFISRISGLSLNFGQSDFRLIDKKVLKVILEMPEYHKFLRGQVSWIGFRQEALSYDVGKRHSGKPKYSYKTLYELAMNGIFSFGKYPLHLVMLFSLVVFAVSSLYMLFIFINRVLMLFNLWHFPAFPGWTALVMVVLFLGSIQLMTIGILGEYVGRIFDQTKKRPVFIVRETSNEK
ncbi:MAG: glycosyltransferase family 2 protein [Omnitrophica bacterium]|nr:glycosyltransferase family 2 protein [Candidatus Omnitrophota bacterium]